MSAQIMSLFGSLSSSNIDERVSAATSILSHLTQPRLSSLPHHQTFDLQDGSDLSYTLKRLVRGLASPTSGARLGFSITLCEILKRLPQLSPQAVFDLIISATPLQCGLKASEERDSLFGRLFGIKCIIQSGVLFTNSNSSQGSHSEKLIQDQPRLLKELLDELSALVSRAPWLSESCGSVLVSDLIIQILQHPDSPLSQSGALDRIIEKFLTNVEVWTLEQLSLVMVLQQHSIKLKWTSILSKTFPDQQILSKANHEKLFTILTKGDGVSPLQQPQSGQADTDNKPAVTTADLPICPHFIHGIIIAASQSAVNFELSSFYNHLFEHHYFAEDATVSRRSHGFLILNKILESKLIPDEDKPKFLTSNCVHTLRIQLAVEDRLLHKMAEFVVSNMISASDQQNTKGSSLAKGLASRITALSPNFDQQSRSKLVKTLVARMETPDLVCWTRELISALRQGSPPASCQQSRVSTELYDSQYPPERFREFVLTHLCNIINMKTLACTAECADSIIRCLTLCAFFGETQDESDGTISTPSIPFPPGLRELCKARLYTCLFDLIDRTKIHVFDQKSKPKASQVVDPLNGFRASEVVIEVLNSRIGSSNLQKQPESSECIKIVQKILSDLRARFKATKSRKLQSKRDALVLLCEIIYLMAHAEQDGWTEALPLTERLSQDLNILLPSSDADSKVVQHNPSLAPAIANLTECLLFLLSWPIALLRIVVEINFAAFSDCIGAESLKLLIDRINPPDSLPVDESNTNDADSTSSEANDENDENDSTADDSSADDDADSDDETMTADGSVDEEFRNDVAMALGHALNTTAESKEDSGDESELMDDDEMLALDVNLAALFKRRSGKKLTRVQNTQDLHLRMKILELIGKLIKLNPESATRGHLIKPLLELIGRIDSSEVIMKQKVIKIIEDAIRLPCTQPDHKVAAQGFSATEASHIAATVHLIAQTTRSADTEELCAKCNIWLVDVIRSKTSLFLVENQRQEALENLVKIHQQSLENFCSKRTSKLKPSFFSRVFKRFPAFGWLFRNHPLRLSLDASTVNTYRREQMLQLVSTMVNNWSSKNQFSAEPIKELEDYLRQLKDSIFSLRKLIVDGEPESGLSKDRSTELKLLKEFTKIASNAQRKYDKTSVTKAEAVWGVDDIEVLREFSHQIPAGPQANIVSKLIQSFVAFLEKSSVQLAPSGQQASKPKPSPIATTKEKIPSATTDPVPEKPSSTRKQAVDSSEKTKKKKKKIRPSV